MSHCPSALYKPRDCAGWFRLSAAWPERHRILPECRQKGALPQPTWKGNQPRLFLFSEYTTSDVLTKFILIHLFVSPLVGII